MICQSGFQCGGGCPVFSTIILKSIGLLYSIDIPLIDYSTLKERLDKINHQRYEALIKMVSLYHDPP